MACLTIPRISEDKYREVLRWCDENIEGFTQTMMFGDYKGGVFCNAKIDVPTVDDAAYFILVWEGQLGNG